MDSEVGPLQGRWIYKCGLGRLLRCFSLMGGEWKQASRLQEKCCQVKPKRRVSLLNIWSTVSDAEGAGEGVGSRSWLQKQGTFPSKGIMWEVRRKLHPRSNYCEWVSTRCVCMGASCAGGTYCAWAPPWPCLPAFSSLRSHRVPVLLQGSWTTVNLGVRWSMMLAMGFSQMPFFRLRKFPSVSNAANAFTMKWCYSLSNAFHVAPFSFFLFCRPLF